MTNLSATNFDDSVEFTIEKTRQNTATSGVEIRIEQLHKYYGKVSVLENLNLNIRAGEFIAVVGRSGCGKSTLLRLIADLEESSQGNIHFSAHRAVSKNDIRVMFQDPRLLPWRSIVNNVKLGLPKNKESEALALLDRVGLDDKVNLWPSQLSGGQRQRAALARALLHRPKVLLLDEPLGALDALTRLDMQNLIEKLWLEQGFTTVLVTHDVSEAVQLADRIILLNRGEIAEAFQVNLPRPRQKTAQFIALEQNVLQAVLAT
ncbi:ABC transporter ATP-binding protein [Acinetobacter nectaris]|uniref:ABC transporter ATP-binding protein n=1 Tax=Acinetobacter nectaris TaxID=1219382 RepID=UPI001F00208E|nr:ATP-binding cassette domain-containing protein [Acinetobacter nectaris]MCF8999591.1 ATP-binding cassette domain-containing protein [Acinetobacter nectaris]MCF9027171.1 ATP-binding cassette domain-containing protein [Acinetobacter nectaris]